MSRVREYIKSRIAEFWKQHPNFDDRNPEHIREVETLLHELSYDFPPTMIVEAIEELRREAEKEVEEARKRFIEAIKKVRRNE